MIAADTSTWIAYLQGEAGEDVELLDRALLDSHLLMVPAVLSELLSDATLPPQTATDLLAVPMIDLQDGYWERAGRLRAKVLAGKKKARLGDALIAQCCVDRDVPLITRDGDFKALAACSTLSLAAQ